MSSSCVRRLPPLPSPRDLLRLYGLRAKKSLSQNFLLDPSCLDRLARTASLRAAGFRTPEQKEADADPDRPPLQGLTVVEVGPGPGGITRALIGNGAREVHVVEKDERFFPSLQLLQEASGNVLHVNIGDCRHYNMSRLFQDELRVPWDSPSVPDIRLVGNLPFNVATPFIIGLIRSMQRKDNVFSYGRVPLLLTFQHEFAFRLIAPPGATERSRLSIIAQNFADVRYLYKIRGGAFVPKPKVDVGVVSLVPLRRPYIDLPFWFVEKVATTVFHGKQKCLKNTVKRLFPLSCDQMKFAHRLLDTAELDQDRTAISLSMDEMERICYVYKQICDEHPFVDKYFDRTILQETLAYQEENRLLLGYDQAEKEKAGRNRLASGERSAPAFVDRY